MSQSESEIKPAHIGNQSQNYWSRQGNPFVPPPVCQRPSVIPWEKNELVLTDSCLRAQAGVTPLDDNIFDVYQYAQGRVDSRLCRP